MALYDPEQISRLFCGRAASFMSLSTKRVEWVLTRIAGYDRTAIFVRSDHLPCLTDTEIRELAEWLLRWTKEGGNSQ